MLEADDIDKMWKLKQNGISISAIGRKLGCSRATVRKYLAHRQLNTGAGTFPDDEEFVPEPYGKQSAPNAVQDISNELSVLRRSNDAVRARKAHFAEERSLLADILCDLDPIIRWIDIASPPEQIVRLFDGANGDSRLEMLLKKRNEVSRHLVSFRARLRKFTDQEYLEPAVLRKLHDFVIVIHLKWPQLIEKTPESVTDEEKRVFSNLKDSIRNLLKIAVALQ